MRLLIGYLIKWFLDSLCSNIVASQSELNIQINPLDSIKLALGYNLVVIFGHEMLELSRILLLSNRHRDLGWSGSVIPDWSKMIPATWWPSRLKVFNFLVVLYLKHIVEIQLMSHKYDSCCTAMIFVVKL